VMMRSIQPDSAVCFEMADLTDRDRLFDWRMSYLLFVMWLLLHHCRSIAMRQTRTLNADCYDEFWLCPILIRKASYVDLVKMIRIEWWNESELWDWTQTRFGLSEPTSTTSDIQVCWNAKMSVFGRFWQLLRGKAIVTCEKLIGPMNRRILRGRKSAQRILFNMARTWVWPNP
jgi:hypothetical protein